MYPFGGQMHLCDFGASLRHCPEMSNCIGPGGTVYSPARLYNYNVWSTRMFVRDSLKAILPEQAEMIDENVDPGEYGLENYYCRLVCIFIFMLAVVQDLSVTIQVAKTHWHVPTCAESWITYSTPSWASKEEVKKIKGLTELDMVTFAIAGIPAHWKIFNFLFILLPKLALWLAVARSGVHYLMETAGIVDLIVNSMALAFVLDMDELIFNRFTTSLTRHIMGSIQKIPIFDLQNVENETDAQALERFRTEEFGRATLWRPWHPSCTLLPFLWLRVPIETNQKQKGHPYQNRFAEPRRG